MQQQTHQWQVPRGILCRLAAMGLLALAAWLAALALVSLSGGSVQAAPRSGAPSLAIIELNGNNITLEGEGWTPGETITLSYSTNASCIPSNRLPISNNPFSIESGHFQIPITWPNTIVSGTYYLCGEGTVTSGPIAAEPPITVNSNGLVQPTQVATPTPTLASGGGTPIATTSPGSTPDTTATTGGTTGSGNNQAPGNKASSSGNGTSTSTLIAIIILCLLVLALLLYLIRIWLRGRQPGGPAPGGSGQP